MNQTSAIAAALIIAFVVFVTVRGELPCYLEVLGISTGGQCSVSATGAVSSAGATVGVSTGGVSLGGAPGSGGINIGLPKIGINV